MKFGRLFAYGRAKPLFPPSVPLSQRLAYRLQNSRYGWTEAPGQTLGSLYHLDAEPCWVRLIYGNDQPVAWSVDGAAVSPTTRVSPDFEPYTNDAEAPWRRVTFNHCGADADPLADVGEPIHAIEVPANPREDGRPVLIFSDWMPVRAIPRADGGHGYLLQVRTYSAGRIRNAGSVGLPDPAIGRLTGGFVSDGNATVPPWTCEPVASDRVFAAYGIQYISPVAGATVIGIGDSIMHSSCTSGELSGFGVRACARVSRPDRPVSYFNEGYPGRNTSGFCANGAWGIRHLAPQVALIQTWSQNEATTPESADLAFARATALADLSRRQGCVPILTTAAPVFAEDAGSERHRVRNVARVRDAAALGTLVLDLDLLWGTGQTPNAYRLETGVGDLMHPSDEGCRIAGEVLADMLERLFGS